jgi:hypothetical protein
MLKVGELFHKRESLVKAIEMHGILVGRKAKFISKLSCGNGVYFKCASFEEEEEEEEEEAIGCVCSFSVYFAKSRKKCDNNMKNYDINGLEVDNSVWFIPRKAKICTIHTCQLQSNNKLKNSSFTSIVTKQIEMNALSAKAKFEHFKSNLHCQPFDKEGSFRINDCLFISLDAPKLMLKFEPQSGKSTEVPCDYLQNKKKSNRIPKLVRATTQQTPHRSMIEENIKSELAILLDELDARYKALTIEDPKENKCPPLPDPLLVAHENEIEAVKFAIREKFYNESFLFHTEIKTEKNGKNIQSLEFRE